MIDDDSLRILLGVTESFGLLAEGDTRMAKRRIRPGGKLL